jgi:ribonuclease P protein component
LGRSEKLKSRKRIEQLFASGKSFGLYPLRVLYLQPTEPEAPVLQCAFSVSTRHFKKAVHRNRIKRLLREAWRLQKNELAQQLAATQKKLAVFIIYTNSELPKYPLLFEKTGLAIQRLTDKINQPHEKLL